MRRAAIFLALPIAVLAGCNRDKPQAVETGPQPVLQGSVSDAMLQTDELHAPAPLAEPVASGVPEAALGVDEPAVSRPARRPRARPTDDATTARPATTSASPRDTAGSGAADKNEPPAPKATRSARPTPSPTPKASPSPRPTRSPRATPSPKATSPDRPARTP
jgi:hypothetical protein